MASSLALLGKVERFRRQARAHRRVPRSALPSSDSLLDFVPAVSPHLTAPAQLGPYVAELMGALGSEKRIVASTPPQHGKTETTCHALAWWCLKEPDRRHAYVTYQDGRAGEIALRVQQICDAAGIKWEGNRHVMHIGERGSIIFTGIGGPLTGYGIDGVLVVDDPIKNRQEADSVVYRERTYQWLHDVALTRAHPGASVIVIQTRWHVDDLAGRLISEGWNRVNLPALNDAGEALWPEMWPAEYLEKRRAENAYTWASLYQGEPRPKGGTVFGEPSYYDDLPERSYRVGYGIDLAYTAKTHADWSVCIEGWWHDGQLYIVHVDRKQVDAPSFTLTLKARQSDRRGPMLWYAGGTEKGAGDFVRQKVPRLKIRPPKGDKLVRATPVSEAWNLGNVLVPANDEPWRDSFLDEVQNFTGVNDSHDDQVDALAALFDVLKKSGGGTGRDDYDDALPRFRM